MCRTFSSITLYFVYLGIKFFGNIWHICRMEYVNLHHWISLSSVRAFVGEPVRELRRLSNIIDFQDARNPSVQQLSAADFNKLVSGRAEGTIWLVDFFAPWCGPCQEVSLYCSNGKFSWETTVWCWFARWQRFHWWQKQLIKRLSMDSWCAQKWTHEKHLLWSLKSKWKWYC